MAAKLTTPRVYKDEIPSSFYKMTAVDTAVPVFIGTTEKAECAGTPIPTHTLQSIEVTEPQLIRSLLDYEACFGKGGQVSFDITLEETYTQVSMKSMPWLQKRKVTAAVLSPVIQTLYAHLKLYFANGGGPCYIIRVGDASSSTLTKEAMLAGLAMAQRYDEPTLIVMPQVATIAPPEDAYAVYVTALQQAAERQDRMVLLDCPEEDPIALRAGLTGLYTNQLRYGAAYYPFLHTTISYTFDVADAEQWNFTLKRKTLPRRGLLARGQVPEKVSWKALPADIQALILFEVGKLGLTLPPSAALAGIYCREDFVRGVWKSHAHVVVSSVKGLTKSVSDHQQRDLNVDVQAGKSINVIKAFAGLGILVWGARTLAGNDNEWRYIPVVRFCMMVQQSCKKVLERFESEPNEIKTWVQLKTVVEDFLMELWRKGALQGAKPEHAYSVKIGLPTTMTEQDIHEGRMIIEVGLAVVRSAEFILFRLVSSTR
jgi:phage tail sheath protein FI